MSDTYVIVFVPGLLCSELVDSDGSTVWPPNYRQLVAETLDYFNKHWGKKNTYRGIEDFMKQLIKQGNTDGIKLMTEDILSKLLDPAAVKANGQIIEQFYDLASSTSCLQR